MANRNENQEDWENNPALVNIFYEQDLKEYIEDFGKGFPVDQKEIELLEVYKDYLIEKGKNRKLYEDLKESKKLISDLKRNRTITLRHENTLNKLREDILGYAGKIPPQNVRLEEIVLGSYMKFPKLIKQGKISQPYLNLMWYKEAHLKIHSVIMNSFRKVTPQVVISDLRRIGELDDVGGPYHINLLAEDKEVTDDLATINMYTDELEHHYGKRRLIGFATELTNLAYDEDKIQSVPDTIREQSAKILELLPFKHRQFYDKKAAVVQVQEDLADLEKRKGLPKVSTGFKKLDGLTHGILPGKLFINGARGKMGKTILTTGISDNVVEQGYDAAYFSHEVPLKEMINRSVSKKTGIDFGRFEYNPNGFSMKEKKRIEEALEEIKNSKLHYEPGRAPSLDYIVGKSKQLKMTYPDLKLIVFDGIQAYGHLVPDRGNKSDFFTKVMETMKYEIAEPLEVCVFLNGQLKTIVDESYKGPNKKYNKLFMPSAVGEFSDCKGIPDVCDGAFGIWRGEYYFPDNEKYKDKMKIIPLTLRSENKHLPPVDIGCDIKTMKVYDI